MLSQCFYSVFFSRTLDQVDFKFKFELLFEFSLLDLIATCKETSIFLIQMSQSKFTILKTRSKKIFGKFMEYLPCNTHFLQQ
jgi:hypothetical protein